MENNEVMANAANEVLEAKGTGKGLIIAAIVGVTILAGGIVYKKVIVPFVAKRKAKKAAEAANPETEAAQTNG